MSERVLLSMDIIRVRELCIRPRSQVCGCLRVPKMQVSPGFVLQRYTPVLAAPRSGKRCRVKGTAIRASIPPDVAIAAITAAAAVLPACWLYSRRFKLAATISSSSDKTESGVIATAFGKPSNIVAQTEILPTPAQGIGLKSAVDIREVSEPTDYVSESHNSNVENELKEQEHRFLSGFLASTSESATAEIIGDHAEVLEDLRTDQPIVDSRSEHVNLLSPLLPFNTADEDSADTVQRNLTEASSSLEGDMLAFPMVGRYPSLDRKEELSGNNIDSPENKSDAGISSDGASGHLIEKEEDSAGGRDTEGSELQNNIIVNEKVESISAGWTNADTLSTIELETTDVMGKTVGLGLNTSSGKSKDTRSHPANEVQSRDLRMVHNIAPSMADDTKTSNKSKKLVDKSKGRIVPRILSEILPIEESADADLHLRIYRALLSSERIQDCVLLLEAMDKVRILDTSKIHQSRFFNSCKKQKAVREAFRFTRLLSRPTLQTFNMLISVCREARDVDGGLKALSVAEKSGVKPDAILYTTLISTCAKAGKVDIAFKVYHDMEAAGVLPNIKTYGSLIDGCARAGQVAKAFGVYGIMLSKQVKPDLAIFNTLINACGRAGSLERAFDVLADMKREPCFLQPNHVTYGALMSACAKSGQVERAFDVYRSMRKSGMKGTPECYTAAVHACSQTGDIDLALTVLEDMKKDGVQPDEILFSALVDVAGHANDVDGAFKILDNMKAFGMSPNSITYSAVMGVCSNTGNWERALKLYHEIRARGLLPTVSTFNALITALSDAKQTHEAFSVVDEMKGARVMPDQITYSILLEACQVMHDPDKAFHLYAKAKAEGVVPNESICESVIGICYASIRSRLPAPGYLQPRGVVTGPSFEEPKKQWTNWALSVYRQTVAAGYTPTLKSLSLLLGCLRKHEAQQDKSLSEDTLFPHDDIPKDLPSLILDAGGLYDPRAFVFFEEAASLGVVPRLNYTAGPITLNAEMLPSYVAEVSLLTLLQGLKKRHDAGAQLYPVTIKHFFEMKQTLTATREIKKLAISGRSGQSMAALLRRLRLHYQGHESSGKLLITVASMKKSWKPATQSQTVAKIQNYQGLASLRPRNVFVAKGIAEQQRAIRFGDGPTSPSKVDFTE
ncbi:protein MpPPR_28 [Marchantia polymorpha subsp. ruderalis]|uniref:PROP1-like PPR domain-containing protein n=2 Tax=Marchantia polymorpha TaxID=3197 RepID=A0AAF6B1Q3_MARPO|nr:hypothetical protein MARPO_0039s0078 [Marchantia polymorpha]BBN05937.1 hypothetical protein Mp_3g17160 [Marchantia polymorpha subsp. ruderalis]|eukprot:PTQ40587.1 hypothetical protein MARPO_0039s0078 [Marchantia polymorpha]